MLIYEKVINQLLIMFLMMFVGWFFSKKGYINDEGANQLSNIIYKIATPSIIVRALYLQYDQSILYEIIYAILLSALSMMLSYLVTAKISKQLTPDERFGLIFTNGGFIGLPIVAAIMPEKCLLYASMYVLTSNIIVWTFGIRILDKGKIDFKKIINPAVIAMIVGIIIFTAQIKLPDMILQTLDQFKQLNTVLAMLVLGSYMQGMKLDSKFKLPRSVFLSTMRLMILPILTILVFSIIPNVGSDLKITIIISAAAPVGVLVVLLSKTLGLDGDRALAFVNISNIMSIVTLPIIILLADKIL